MAAPLAKAIYEAAEQAIYDLLIDGKSQAGFQGRQYTALDIAKLQTISNHYRRLAIQRRELPANPTEGPVNVSHAVIRD